MLIEPVAPMGQTRSSLRASNLHAQSSCRVRGQALKRLVDEEFPGMQVVRTEGLHKGVPGARHSFMEVPGDADKLHLLSQVLPPPPSGSGTREGPGVRVPHAVWRPPALASRGVALQLLYLMHICSW